MTGIGSAETSPDVSGGVLVAGMGNLFLNDDGFGPEGGRRLRGEDPVDTLHRDRTAYVLRRVLGELGAFRVSLTTDARNDLWRPAVAMRCVTDGVHLRKHLLRIAGTSRYRSYFAFLDSESPSVK